MSPRTSPRTFTITCTEGDIGWTGMVGMATSRHFTSLKTWWYKSVPYIEGSCLHGMESLKNRQRVLICHFPCLEMYGFSIILWQKYMPGSPLPPWYLAASCAAILCMSNLKRILASLYRVYFYLTSCAAIFWSTCRL